MRLLVHDYAGHPFQMQLSRELARRGHRVVHAFAGGLLTPRGALQRQRADPETLDIREIPMHPNYRRDKYRFGRRRRMEVQYGAALGHLIRELGPDLVISGNTPTEPQWAALRVSLGGGIRFVSWVQDFYSIAVDRLLRKKLPVLGALVGRWYRGLERRTLCASDGVVAITQDFVPLLERLGVARERIAAIPNWAPLEDLPLEPQQNLWSRQVGLEGYFCLLYSGTLAMKHNPDLLRQLAVHFRANPQVRVVVVSEGPGADWLAARKSEERLENLVLLPYQDFAVMSQVLAAAEILIAVLEPDAGMFSVPSKVLTYHCAGKAILAAIPAQNLAARLINQNGSGLCVEPGQGPEFVAGAERLFGDREFRIQCGRQARRYAEKNFDIQRIADRFEEFFIRIRGQQ